MKRQILYFLLLIFVTASCSSETVTYNLKDYGVVPDTGEDMTANVVKAIKTISQESALSGKASIIKMKPGKYDFYPENAEVKEYYISNHDQVTPKRIAFAFEGIDNMTFNGRGAKLIFHSRMMPMSVVNCTNVVLKNFSIDAEIPHILQIKIVDRDTSARTITFEPAPWVKYEIRDGRFVGMGEGWEYAPQMGIAFEGKTKRLVYNTSDVQANLSEVELVGDNRIVAHNWRNDKLIPGTVMALRTWYRPNPGIFMSHSKDVVFEDIKVHYAEGMGLLAQMSENITLDGFSVCLKGKDDPRYFSTQADATHFSGCKGKIISKNGLYEGMMDDAINVHGTYLRVKERIDGKTVVARYMHPQAYGFEWGMVGDTVQFIKSSTMELEPLPSGSMVTVIESIAPKDKPTVVGAKEYLITFKDSISAAIDGVAGFGIENLEWSPEVLFSENIIRNNRARGSLFSTPRKTIVEKNLFDHTSGTAILLCGDCNGWYETGACRDVLIRKNIFINALTNYFQFTNAVISIYPEIPNLEGQVQYFHGGKPGSITIEENVFMTFDNPILYAKSVDGLVFKNNVIQKTTEYPPFHWNKKPFLLERVINSEIEENIGN